MNVRVEQPGITVGGLERPIGIADNIIQRRDATNRAAWSHITRVARGESPTIASVQNKFIVRAVDRLKLGSGMESNRNASNYVEE